MIEKEKHAILSEKPEDQIKAGEWGKKQVERMKRNKKIGDESWLRVLPAILSAKKKIVQ